MQPNKRQPPDERPSDDRGSDPVEDLLAVCIERVGREGEAAVEAVCREHPSHAEEIRRAILGLKETGLLGEADGESAAGGGSSFPERLGDFRLIRRIGGGGMGVVYLAEQESLGRRVALKLIRPEHLYFAGSRERFRREVESVARLQHPGIVPIYTVGEASGIPYFAMEWIHGCTLADVLKKLGDEGPERLSGADLARAVQACSPSDADEPTEGRASAAFEGSWAETCLRVVRDVALALEHAHARGVIHRDVKPSNVGVTRGGRIVLLDFGLARARGGQKLTRTGSELGSLAYMSPEQVKGDENALGPRTDIYSLGVTLYELLTLKVPYLSETTEVTRRLILDGRPDAIRLRNRAIGRDAETVCLKAMERDPARRYATAADLARDIENVLGHRPIEARRPGAWIRSMRWMERHPAMSAALALGALLVLGSVGFAIREHASNLAIRRLSDLQLIRYYETKAESFWPADPAQREGMDAWVGEAERLLSRRTIHRAYLEALRKKSLPYTEEMQRKDQADARARLSGLRTERAKLLEFLKGTPSVGAPDQRELATIEALIAQDEEAVGRRSTWTFSDPADQWLNDMLLELSTELDHLSTVISRVRKQRDAATFLEEQTLVGCAEKWREASRDIEASEVYGHRKLSPQVGLVPLWKDSQSGLWEFVHVLSGEAPALDPAKSAVGVKMTPETGIVLVLLPGGAFTMGAEPPTEGHPVGSPHVDAQAKASEKPVHSVSLDWFFLSKYEVTLAQWGRIRSEGPEGSSAATGPMIPVSVSWENADRAIRRCGLFLPTEAQWEYACRAGTSTVFSAGDAASSLEGFANLADQSFLGDSSPYAGTEVKGEEWLQDGYATEAPVGSFKPNEFGLYDMHGNVSEMCEDWLIFRGYATMAHREGDGLLFTARRARARVQRGGNWARPALEARSASRLGVSPERMDFGVGVRPARPVFR